jgi:hypothetical protein
VRKDQLKGGKGGRERDRRRLANNQRTGRKKGREEEKNGGMEEGRKEEREEGRKNVKSLRRRGESESEK